MCKPSNLALSVSWSQDVAPVATDQGSANVCRPGSKEAIELTAGRAGASRAQVLPETLAQIHEFVDVPSAAKRA